MAHRLIRRVAVSPSPGVLAKCCAHGEAWDSFPHDHARSRAYRWGEDGIAGMSDADQHLCLSLALCVSGGVDPRKFGGEARIDSERITVVVSDAS
jgi:hypothetical protein